MNFVKDAQETIGGAGERAGPAGGGDGRGWGLGSGVVIGQGQVLTNAHNVRRDEVTVAFADGRREVGRVAGADPDFDVAVIAVETGDTPAVEWQPNGAPPIGTPLVGPADP